MKDEEAEKDEKKSKDVKDEETIITVKKNDYNYLIESINKGNSNNKPLIKSVEKVEVDLNPYKFLTGSKSKITEPLMFTVEQRLATQEKLNFELAEAIKNCQESSAMTGSRVIAMTNDLSKKFDTIKFWIDTYAMDFAKKVSDVKEAASKDENLKVSNTTKDKNPKMSDILILDKNRIKYKNKDEKIGNDSIKDLPKDMKETLKLGFLNKSGHIRRNYKLDKETKFEFFYDYLTSELRSNELLHILEENNPTN